jgi:predicted cupin superfamily sugar epimerase
MEENKDPIESQPQYWIKQLGLEPHPEGGHFAEVYRSAESIPKQALPSRFGGDRTFCTGIFYLLEAGDFSAFHRIKSDETWHFYAGGPLDVLMLSKEGVTTVRLGCELHKGQVLQMTVPAEVWFAARPVEGSGYTLTGCTVSPGFDFADFEMGSRQELTTEFPACQRHIEELTRE